MSASARKSIILLKRRTIVIVAGEAGRIAGVAEEKFIVGHPRDLPSADLDLIADGRAGMGRRFPRNPRRADDERTRCGRFRNSIAACMSSICTGKIFAVELAAKNRFEIFAEALGAVDVQLEAGRVGGSEKRETLDVVPVGVGDEKVQPSRGGLGDLEAEFADAGAGVEDETVVAMHDRQAGGIAAVAEKAGARRGRGAARSPEIETAAPSGSSCGLKGSAEASLAAEAMPDRRAGTGALLKKAWTASMSTGTSKGLASKPAAPRSRASSRSVL